MMYVNNYFATDHSQDFSFPSWLKDEHYEQCDNFERDYLRSYFHPIANMTKIFNFVFHKAYK